MSNAIVPANQSPEPNYELPELFVARENELDEFQTRLERWQKVLERTAVPAEPPAAFVPTFSQQVTCPVILVYGRGGYGKSTLLREWRKLADEFQDGYFRTALFDCESFNPDEKITLRHPSSPEAAATPQLERLEATTYFNLLRAKLATALNLEAKDFKEYEAAKKAVKEAQERAERELQNLRDPRRENKFEWVGNLSGSVLKYALKNLTGSVLPDKVLETIEKNTGKAVNFSATQLHELRQRLHDRLATALGDFLEPELRLARGLGRDLFFLAKRKPLLLFVDTYELMSEGDDLLRLVMSGAGGRVGFVLAGRDDVYSDRSLRGTKLAGYQSVSSQNLGLAVNFLNESKGAFSKADLRSYFDWLAQERPHIPPVPDSAIESVYELTLGIPLAVRIVAATYLRKPDLALLQPEVTPQPSQDRATLEKDVIEVVVRRYLMHAEMSPGDKLRLFALALLRRPVQLEQTKLLEATLNPPGVDQKVPPDGSEFLRLHRRYSFVFQKDVPILHDEVREFFRRWLPDQPDVPLREIARQMAVGALAALLDREALLNAPNLRTRLEDSKWCDFYLDWLALLFWADPERAVRYALPFGIAAGVYQPSLGSDIIALAEHCTANLSSTEATWWQAFSDVYQYDSSKYPNDEEKKGLAVLVNLVANACPVFPPELALPQTAEELRAAVNYRKAQALEIENAEQAFKLYEETLTFLTPVGLTGKNLKLPVAELVWSIARKLQDEKKYLETLPYLNRAIELNPDYADAYFSLGYNLDELEKYDYAIAAYSEAIRLNPKFAVAYNNRGNSYDSLGKYGEAIKDYDEAIRLNPQDVIFYTNRGATYRRWGKYGEAIKDYDEAIRLNPQYARACTGRGFLKLLLKQIIAANEDYTKACELDKTNLNTYWMAEWARLGWENPSPATINKLEEVAAIDPEHYVSYVCRGVAYGLRGNKESLGKGLAELEKAIPLEPDEWDAYFWKGMLLAYKGHYTLAQEAIEKSLAIELPPVLLLPLRWTEQHRLDFWQSYAKPLLEKYDLLT